MKYLRVTALFVVVSILSPLRAGTYNLAAEYSAGTGSSAATIVVDFGLEAYAFTYNWDGTATGWDALNAIDQAGELDAIAIDYGSWGMYIYALLYQDAAIYNYGTGVTQGWAYFSSENGSDWYTTDGVSFRNLVNGSWDAYVWSNYDFTVSWDPLRQPGQSPLPVPEPATLLLAGLGAAVLKRRIV